MFYAVCSLLALGLLALDQWSKAWITANLPLGETMDFLPGVLGLRAVHNYGAAWSSFSGQRWLLVAVRLSFPFSRWLMWYCLLLRCLPL